MIHSTRKDRENASRAVNLRGVFLSFLSIKCRSWPAIKHKINFERNDSFMAGRYKGRTTANQVAIREDKRDDAAVLIRVPNGSDIEVSTTTSTGDGYTWREVAYAYKKHGYMMNSYISVTDATAKYYMYDTLEAFGDRTLMKGHSDELASSGPIHNVQRALNKLATMYVNSNPARPLQTIAVDGDFGSATKTAVENAQDFMGCSIDGKVGPHTKARLYRCAYGHGGWPLAENAD